MIADTFRLRDWLERDSFWHCIAKEAVGVIQGLQGVYDNLPRDCKFFEWLEFMKDAHHPFMFQGDAKTRKTLKNEAEQKELMQKPVRRMIYRYFYDDININCI